MCQTWVHLVIQHVDQFVGPAWGQLVIQHVDQVVDQTWVHLVIQHVDQVVASQVCQDQGPVQDAVQRQFP